MARKSVQGIEPRHTRTCPARGWEDCNCKPAYQANVWSKRDGKRIRKTFPSLAAAKAWRTDAMQGLRQGKLRAPMKDTVRQAGEALIAGMRDSSVRDRSGKVYKASTRRSYRASLEQHVYPEFGGCKLSAVSFPDLQDFVDRLAAQGLDGSTIRNTVNPLRVMFRRARYSVPVNPTTGLEIIARGEKPRRVVTAEVAARMVESIPLEERALRATAFFAGLRAGELQALRIEDIELFPEGRWGLVHIREAWDKREGSQAPKSVAGKRTVPVCEPLFDVLDEHLLRLGRTSGLISGVPSRSRSPTRGTGGGRSGRTRPPASSPRTCSCTSAATRSRRSWRTPGFGRVASTGTWATPTTRCRAATRTSRRRSIWRTRRRWPRSCGGPTRRAVSLARNSAS